MTIHSFALRRLAVRIVVIAAPLCACAAVLGIDDGHPRAVGDDGGATIIMESDGAVVVVGADGSIESEDAGDSSVITPTTLPDGAPIPNGCENLTLDPTKGIFVAKTGATTPSCGTPSAPCLLIQTGIDRAHDATMTPNVYVADGTYSEALALKSGVNVIGGWIPSSSGPWARDCGDQKTTITAPSGQNVTVTASDFPSGSPSKLSTLSIVSGDPALQPGESLFGVLATGSGTVLNLVWVNVTTGGGGGGAPGAVGQVGATPTSPCATPGDAAGGGMAGTTGAGADAGTFSSGGYVAGTGQQGTQGSGGANGGPGGDAGCVPCFNCSGLVCSETTAGTNCGTPGQPGCGGGGGQGGTGGGSGGSSVAIVAIDARVVLGSCVLTAGGGGNGGGGGPGGGGGGGGPGAAGSANPTTCVVACGGLGVGACTITNGSGAGGATGGMGGRGAVGGRGGDGAGGDSFAVVEVGNAAVDDPDASSTYTYGAPGAGGPDGGNGAPGRAGAQGP